jgi:hypothetical protein
MKANGVQTGITFCFSLLPMKSGNQGPKPIAELESQDHRRRSPCVSAMRSLLM